MSVISCLVLATVAIGAMAQDFTGYSRVPGNCPGSKLAEYPNLPFAECAKRCSENAQCKGFTIPSSLTESGLCILKSTDCTQPEPSTEFAFHSKKQALYGAAFVDDVVPWYPPAAYPVPAPAAYAGYYYGGIAGFTRANGNCQGNFLSGVLALPIDQCAAQCLATAGCAGFSFNFHAAYPQCILKAASCAYPDPGAVFTYFARAAPAPIPAPAPYYPPYYPDVYVPDYPSYPIYTPWVKSARKFFTYSNELCSGAIKKTVDLDIEKCADACLADSECHGFSFDNHAASAPFTCILRAEPCQKRENSTRWSFFERQSAEKFDLDVKYLEDLESGKQEKQAAEHVAAAQKPTSFFDLQRFFAQRPNGQVHHQAGAQDEIKRF